MEFKCIIFDLDGTLIDSFRDIVDAWNEALFKSGFPTLSSDDYQNAVRHGKTAVLKLVVPKDESEHSADLLLRKYKASYRKRWDAHTKAFPLINPMLAELGKRGVKCAVLSNKSQKMADLCCRRFLMSNVFSMVCGANEEFLPKPAPDQALSICRQLGIPPNQAAIIGDSQIDLETALNAGTAFFSAKWGWPLHKSQVRDSFSTDLFSPIDVLNHV